MTEDPERRLPPIFSDEEIEGTDWFLSKIVELSSVGIEPRITLTTGAGTITGKLISGKRYFETLSASVQRATFTGTDAESFRTTMADFYGGWAALYDPPEERTPDWKPAPPSYIHLAEAFWISPPNQRLSAGADGLWRGRLDKIIGFAMGGAPAN